MLCGLGSLPVKIGIFDCKLAFNTSSVPFIAYCTEGNRPVLAGTMLECTSVQKRRRRSALLQATLVLSQGNEGDVQGASRGAGGGAAIKI